MMIYEGECHKQLEERRSTYTNIYIKIKTLRPRSGNPPSAEEVRGAEGIALRAESSLGGSGTRGFLQRPRMALWPVQGYLSSSLRSWTSFARKGLRWI